MKPFGLLLLLLMIPFAGAALPVSTFMLLPTVRLHYLDWQGSGHPLVLVPGGCQTAHVFGDLAPLLAQQFRVMAVTPRGCGQSGPAMDGYGIDRQIDDLVAFLDAMSIKRAVFAGHSSGGGVVVRLANRYPERVDRVVTFDVVYKGVPDQFEARMEQAIASKVGPQHPLSAESHRANFEAWELGVWSDGLKREFYEQTEQQGDGSLRYRRRRPEWQAAFVEDMKSGLYFDARLHCPALFFVAQDLDLNRVRQFPPAQQRDLLPMARAIRDARRKQVKAFQRNGAHVQVIWMKNASHYLFIDRAPAVAKEMIKFLPPSKRLAPR